MALFYVVAGVTFPEGMAGTKRVKHYLTSMSEKEYSVGIVNFENGKAWCESINLGSTEVQIFRFKLSRLFNLVNLLSNKRDQKCLLVYSGISLQNIHIVLLAKIFNWKIIVDYVEDFRYHQENVSTLRKLKIRSILFFENHITKLADGLIVISKHLCSKFVDITKGSIPIQLISIAVDLDSKPQTTIPASNSGKFNIVYSGSFGNKDGLDIVFRAIRELNEEGYAVNLCLTGSKDNLHNLQGIHDHPNIKFLGYLSSEELTKLQMGADVLLMSRVNSMQNVASFPFKLGEYLLTGKPVIATSVGDVVDYLQDGVNAFLIEPESVTALKNAIIQILTNPENASFVGLVGYNTCIKYFSKEVVAQNLVRLIDSIYTSAPKDNISAPFYDKKNK